MSSMDIQLKPGTYIVAVSGGVDSMALLHLLVSQYATSPDVRFVVAHYDHGIRSNSHLDRQLVQAVARQHGLPFVYNEGKLGAGASEDVARQARYAFLHQTRKAARAKGIILAHHQDDFLETAVHNLLRGTNRRGLSALKSEGYLVRPLLHTEKRELTDYAHLHELHWIEDSTNEDTSYRRNYIRHKLLTQFDSDQKHQLAQTLWRVSEVNRELDQLLANYLHIQDRPQELNRHTFIMLPHTVAREVLAAWLRANGITTYDQAMLERLVAMAKTLPPGKFADVCNGYQLVVKKRDLALRRLDR